MTTVHEVLRCTCGDKERHGHLREIPPCPVPGHGTVPRDPVDPWTLVEAGREALTHLDAAVQSVLAARAAWVSRGLDDTNPFPRSLDRLAGSMTRNWEDMRRWTAAARVVAERRSGQGGDEPTTTERSGS
jgi:hypothetical protein